MKYKKIYNDDQNAQSCTPAVLSSKKGEKELVQKLYKTLDTKHQLQWVK